MTSDDHHIKAPQDLMEPTLFAAAQVRPRWPGATSGCSVRLGRCARKRHGLPGEAVLIVLHPLPKYEMCGLIDFGSQVLTSFDTEGHLRRRKLW